MESPEKGSRPPFGLRTLGTLRLVDAGDDPVLGDHGHQRRRLALLAVLASAGKRGRSRDQLQGLFWPDVDQARARHSLDQLLYALRSSLGSDLFTGANPLLLNPASIESDIGAFMAAIERGDLETAVDLYSGPFLDGFYLGNAAEFDQWMESERSRIERMYIEALEKLAATAESAGDFTAGARWRQVLVETDPLSSKQATELIRSLMNAGDHAAALQYAQRYQAFIAEHLGSGVGPAMAELVAEVRERARTESVVVRGATPPPPRHQPGSLPEPEDADTDAVATPLLHDAVPAASPVRSRKKFLPLAAAIVGIALVGSYALWQAGSSSSSGQAPADASIAVLPLANLSGDPADAVIADGITEELMGAIGRIERLRVIARTSAFAFRNTALDVRQIAESLHVSNVLEGGVQKAGSRIRVQVRLVDASDGSTRWSESYDRDVRDIFFVQSEIASAVARELDLRLGRPAVSLARRRPTSSIAAYELYLRGNDPSHLRSDSGARSALEYFQQAVALDSNYAAAHAGVARMFMRLRNSDLAGVPARVAYMRARESALKAVALDDSLAEAHATLGLVAMMGGYDFATAEREMKRAVALDPGSSRIREWRANLYYWQNRFGDALTEARRAVENDPLSPSARAEVGRALCANRRIPEGLAVLDSLATVQPPLGRTRLYIATCHAMNGEWRRGAELLSGPEVVGLSAKGNFFGRADMRKEALEVIDALLAHRERRGTGAFEIAIVYAGLGETDRVLEWLEKALSEHAASTQLSNIFFERVSHDRRYLAFRKRIGL